MKFSAEVVRRIYNDEEGVFVEVGPDSDSLDFVQLSATGKENQEYYGELLFVMPPVQARLIAAALIACADEMDSKRTPSELEAGR